MANFNNPDTEQRFIQLHKMFDEFMSITKEALEAQNERIETLTQMCETLNNKASVAQLTAVEALNLKIENLKQHCNLLTENDQILQKMVTANAQDNVQIMKNIENIAGILKSTEK